MPGQFTQYIYRIGLLAQYIQLYSIDFMPTVDLTTKGEQYLRGRRRHFLRCERK